MLRLFVTPVAWQDHFHSIDVHFGSTVASRGHNLKRRQKISSTSTSAVPTSVNFPSPPSTTPTASGVSEHRLNMQFNNTQILPPNFPGVDGASLHGPFIPHGFTVGCKTCTLGGLIDITNGMFSMGSGDNSNTTEGLMDLFDDGFIDVKLNAFDAFIELESTVLASQDLLSFTAPFPDIGIPGFVIAGIAEVGPVLRPQVKFGVQIASSINFTYGLHVTVPNNAHIRLNLTNPQSSSVTNFANSTIAALPFSASVSSINLTASISFSPQLLLTVSAFETAAQLSVGAFLDIPTVSATVAEVRHVNELCEPSTNNTNSTGLNPSGHYYFDNLTNIVPSVQMDLGVLAAADLSAGSFVVAEEKVYTAYATSAPLPTKCLIYDEKAKTFGDPRATAVAKWGKTGAKTGNGGSGQTGKSAAGSVRERNPFVGGEAFALVAAIVVGTLLLG